MARLRANIRNYGKPRPVWIMVLGESLVYIGSAGAGISGFEGNPWITLGFTIVIAGGNFCTRLYSKQNGSDNNE